MLLSPISSLLWLVLGISALVLPGYLLALALGTRERLLATFSVCLLLLFHAVFWLQIAGIRLAFTPVSLCLVGLSAAAALWAWSSGTLVRPRVPVRCSSVSPALQGLALLGVLAGASVIAWRSMTMPLPGPDTPWRWNFLARQIFRQGNFSFYPPRSARDFRLYFYPDGIPPLVSFSYWWLYLSVGSDFAPVTGLFVTVQLLLAAWAAYRLGCRMHSPTAGCWAVALLMGCTTFFFAVVLGQETGLTAISLAATLCFVLEAKQRQSTSALLLGGLAAGVGCLAREYGLAVVLCGVAFGAWQRLSRRGLSTFVAAALATAGPWYVRNWLLTGNPFYSYPIARLPVNPVHVHLLETYAKHLAITPHKLLDLMFLLVGVEPLSIALALLFFLRWPRRLGPLLAVAAVFTLIWLYSVPRTSGGTFYSLRVLSPVFLIVSVAAGIGLASWRLSKFVAGILWAILFLTNAWAIRHNVDSAWRQPDLSVGSDQLAQRVGALPSRILSDDAYLHARLSPSGVDVVPVWSPEVAYLFDQALTGQEIRHRLIASGIRLVSQPAPLNAFFLRSSPLYCADTPNWKPFVQSEVATLFRLPDEPR